MIKSEAELSYWLGRYNTEGHSLANGHYEYFYTKHFELDKEFYSGKRILDIGCGPRGSLEWADNALARIGIEPLSNDYMKIGIEKLNMLYVWTGAENIPFPNNYFDVIASFNSLDHVNDLDLTIEQIKLKLKPKGLFLLITDVNHDPTPAEPITFEWDVISKFMPKFELIEERHYEKSAEIGMYDSIQKCPRYDHKNPVRRYGILSAKFIKL